MVQPRALQTRQRILDTAQAVINDTQTGVVSMSAIASKTGLSRQALYQHFSSRTELLTSAMKEIDMQLDLPQRLSGLQMAADGAAQLNEFIAFWGNYLPEFAAAARSLRLASKEDKTALQAWQDRMFALTSGCNATIDRLEADGQLAESWNGEAASKLMASMLSFDTWDYLTGECDWSTETYVDNMQRLASKAFVRAEIEAPALEPATIAAPALDPAEQERPKLAQTETDHFELKRAEPGRPEPEPSKLEQAELQYPGIGRLDPL